METQVTTLSVYFSVPGPEAALAEVFRLAGDEKRGRVGTIKYTPGELIERNVRFS